MAFGIVFILLLWAVASNLIAVVGVVALVPLAAGCMRMATVLVRDGHTDFGEFVAALRRPWLPLLLGVAQLIVVAVFVVDFMLGAAWGGAIGGVLAISAVYGLAITWAYAVVAWPIVLDPVRREVPIGRRLRLAALLLVAHPLRMGGFALLVGGLLVASTVAIAALVTVALAFACLLSARYVLPAADRLEGRATVDVSRDEG